MKAIMPIVGHPYGVSVTPTPRSAEDVTCGGPLRLNDPLTLFAHASATLPFLGMRSWPFPNVKQCFCGPFLPFRSTRISQVFLIALSRNNKSRVSSSPPPFRETPRVIDGSRICQLAIYITVLSRLEVH